MFRDAKEELRRLEEELLEEDMGEENPDEEAELISQWEELVGDNPAIYDEDAIYNNDHVDEDPEELSRELLKPEKEKLTGLIIAALLLFTAIMAVLIWWVVQVPPELWRSLWNR